MTLYKACLILCLLVVSITETTLAQPTFKEIDSISKLKTLRFEDERDDGYCLLYLPSWLKYCQNVEEVIFYNTKHIDVSKAIKLLSGLPKLEIVRFQRMGLKTVPRNINLLKRIKVIDLLENPIREIPRQMAECQEISGISLSNCSLKEKDLVFILTRFPNLTYLSMEACNIREIPKEICNPSLTYINFYYNPIRSIPKCFFSSKTINTFLISYPSEKHTMKKLQTINVDSIKNIFSEHGNKKVIVD